jgi:hypothetical protein
MPRKTAAVHPPDFCLDVYSNQIIATFGSRTLDEPQ